MPRALKATSAPTTHFRKEGLAFLRALVRVNKTDPVEAREWFNANKAVYEAELKEPMLAIIRHVTDAMLDFAPNTSVQLKNPSSASIATRASPTTKLLTKTRLPRGGRAMAWRRRRAAVSIFSWPRTN